jgi:hypothetical protein
MIAWVEAVASVEAVDAVEAVASVEAVYPRARIAGPHSTHDSGHSAPHL